MGEDALALALTAFPTKFSSPAPTPASCTVGAVGHLPCVHEFPLEDNNLFDSLGSRTPLLARPPASRATREASLTPRGAPAALPSVRVALQVSAK